MSEANLASRIDAVEQRMDSIEDRLDTSFASLSAQIFQFRGEMRSELAATRTGLVARIERGDAELRAAIAEVDTSLRAAIAEVDAGLRVAIAEGDAETRRFMKVLHEDTLARIASPGEHLS